MTVALFDNNLLVARLGMQMCIDTILSVAILTATANFGDHLTVASHVGGGHVVERLVCLCICNHSYTVLHGSDSIINCLDLSTLFL